MFRLLLTSAFIFTISACGGSGGGSTRTITYVAIGASDATGIGAEPITDGYVFRLRKMLEESGFEVTLRNLGIPGARVEEMREFELPVARQLDPELVTVFAGGNDLVQGTGAGEFETDLAVILQELSRLPVDSIAIATLPDLTKLPRFQVEPDSDVTEARIEAFNDIIIRQAQLVGAVIADLHPFDPAADVTASDGFHPNDRGHELIADVFFDALSPL